MRKAFSSKKREGGATCHMALALPSSRPSSNTRRFVFGEGREEEAHLSPSSRSSSHFSFFLLRPNVQCLIFKKKKRRMHGGGPYCTPLQREACAWVERRSVHSHRRRPLRKTNANNGVEKEQDPEQAAAEKTKKLAKAKRVAEGHRARWGCSLEQAVGRRWTPCACLRACLHACMPPSLPASLSACLPLFLLIREALSSKTQSFLFNEERGRGLAVTRQCSFPLPRSSF